MLWKTRLFLIQIYRHHLKLHRCMSGKAQHHIKQGIRVFAAGKTDHDLVTFLDHVEVGQRFSDKLAQLLVTLIFFVLVFTRIWTAQCARGWIMYTWGCDHESLLWRRYRLL